MTGEKFKLPRSSYSELVKIIKGYGAINGQASLDQISTLTALDRTVVSSNSGFLLEIKVVERGNKKQATELGKKLAQALDHDLIDEIRDHWRSIINDCDFLTNILTAVRIRKGMDEQTLHAHIAYSAGQPKNPRTMTGSRAVVDMFEFAGLIVEQDGKYTVVEFKSTSELTQRPTMKTEESTEKVAEALPAVQIWSGQTPSIQLNINLDITCNPDNLGNLGGKICKIIQDITDASGQDENSEKS